MSANSVLIKYLKEGKQKGYNTDQLQKSLIEQGYNTSEILEAISEIENIPKITEEHALPINKTITKKTHNPLVFIIGIVLVIILAVTLILLNVKKEGTKTTGFEKMMPIPEPVNIKDIKTPPLPPMPEMDKSRTIQNKPLNISNMPELPKIPETAEIKEPNNDWMPENPPYNPLPEVESD